MNKIYTYIWRQMEGDVSNKIELPAVNSSGYNYIAQKCAEDLCLKWNYNGFPEKNQKIELDIYDGLVYINTFTIKITHPPVCTVVSFLSDEEK